MIKKHQKRSVYDTYQGTSEAAAKSFTDKGYKNCSVTGRISCGNLLLLNLFSQMIEITAMYA